MGLCPQAVMCSRGFPALQPPGPAVQASQSLAHFIFNTFLFFQNYPSWLLLQLRTLTGGSGRSLGERPQDCFSRVTSGEGRTLRPSSHTTLHVPAGRSPGMRTRPVCLPRGFQPRGWREGGGRVGSRPPIPGNSPEGITPPPTGANRPSQGAPTFP